MVWCAQCDADVELEADEANGFSCCVQCGRVVEHTSFSSNITFAKGADGSGELVGQLVGADGDAHGIGRYSGGRMWASGGGHEAAVTRGRQEIAALVEALRISPSSEAVEAAHRLYRLALQRGFTRGRRVNQVAAVCLYIFCRLERRPYMLIDFSDQLSVNVYTLGAVFLSMLRLLRLDEHATFTKPIDPSLFMGRFVDRLRLPTQELKTKVSNTATRLVQSMKRDWMLTGRRPNGICGAALFLAAHIHSIEKTKTDIISIVHVGWGTVERRLMELAETGGADLTLKEMEERDKALELGREQTLLEYERVALEASASKQPVLVLPSHPGEGQEAEEGEEDMALVGTDPGDGAAGRYCEHVRAGSPLLAHGMCRLCIEEYLQVTMAVQEGAQNPPAYIHNLRRDVRKRVRAQLQTEQTVLLLMDVEGSVGGVGPNDDDDDDNIHAARHLENEAAAEGGTVAGSSAPAVLASDDTAAEAGGSRQVAITAAEEDEFDEALHSSDLQTLARALGGAVAAAATAPLQPWKRPRPDPTSAGPQAVAAAAASTQPVVAATDPEYGGDVREAPREVPATADAGAGTGPGETDGVAMVLAPVVQAQEAAGVLSCALVAASGAARREAGGGVGDCEGGELSSDHLSDVEDEAIAGYLATGEEAKVREQLWVEMNREWIDKQEAKKAAADAGAEGGERAKRKYTRRKAELPAAEDAAGATRNLLAAKKLSNKINYGALADLFGNTAASPGFEAAGQGLASSLNGGGSSSHYVLGGTAAEAVAVAPSTSAVVDGVGGELMSSAAQTSRGRSRAQAAEENRYKSALDEEQLRLGGLGGGGFLGSLTFVRGAAERPGPSARARPQGLSLKPRGR